MERAEALDRYSLELLSTVSPRVSSRNEIKQPTENSSGMLFDTENFAKAYWQLEALYGPQIATENALRLFSVDISWIGWEATKSPLPKKTYYKPMLDGRLIHMSDWITGKDILEGVSNYRDGLEIIATTNMKQTMMQRHKDVEYVMVSPKYDPETERLNRCCYNVSMVNRFKFIEDGTPEGLYELEQWQRETLDRRGSARFLNNTLLENKFSETSSVDEIVTYIGVSKEELTFNYMMKSLAEITGEVISMEDVEKARMLQKQIEDRSRFQAKKLLEAIKRGETGVVLQQTFNDLLLDTVGIENIRSTISSSGEMVFMTSCGAINFGAREGQRMWSLTREKKGILCGGEEGCGKVTYCWDTANPKCFHCKAPLKKNNSTEYLAA